MAQISDLVVDQELAIKVQGFLAQVVGLLDCSLCLVALLVCMRFVCLLFAVRIDVSLYRRTSHGFPSVVHLVFLGAHDYGAICPEVHSNRQWCLVYAFACSFTRGG